MAIYKKGQHTTSGEFNELCGTANDMKLKFLDDGSVWARIHWLDTKTDTTMYANEAQVMDGAGANRFSKMEKIESFGGGMVTLTNLAPTIKGAEGFSAGSASNAEGWHKYSNDSLKLTGTTSTAELYATTNSASLPLVNGHSYYVRAEIKQSALVGSFQVYLGGSTAGSITEPSFFSGKKPSAVNTWTIVSGITTRTFPTGNHKMRLDFDNGKVAGDLYIDGLMVIDLTEAFGSAFTPTQAWCDANIPYFTGTKTIDASSSGFKRWEFLLMYPRYSATLYNRWSQTGSPNTTTPGGYVRITTPWTAHAGPLRKPGGSSTYNCDNVGSTTWYAAIGQYAIWNGGIPSAIDNNPQYETELWVRIDNLSPSQKAKIYDGNHIVGGHIYEF